MRWRAALVASMLLACAGTLTPVRAVQPDEVLGDPQLEERARYISAELRCLVCQNQSIDDSNAPLARDLRLLVRERLKANDSDQAVLDFIVARYGDFVLLKPPFKSETLVLWLTPILVLIGAVLLAWKGGFWRTQSLPSTSSDRPLSDDERRQLDRVLNGNG